MTFTNSHRLKNSAFRLRKRRGGLTFVELIVSLVIIAITSVAVVSGMYVAYGEVERARRKARAVQLLKAEMEFWIGRIHSSFPAPHEFVTVAPSPLNPIVLDSRGTRGSGDDILAQVYRAPIQSVDLDQTPLIHPDWYQIRVWVQYDELPFEPGAPTKQMVLELVAPAIPADV